MKEETIALEWPCPICHKRDCAHFIGWTEDGKTISPRDPSTSEDLDVRETDTILKTGVSARVYRRLYRKKGRA